MISSLEAELLSFEARGIRRQLACGDGVDFCSNDYLGLSRSGTIRGKLAGYLLQEGGLGATGSRLVSGESSSYSETESFLAKIFDVDSALIFGSGYLANIGVMSAFGSDDSEFFSDELNHASLIDGMRLAKGRKDIFRHNDLGHLDSLLCASNAQRKIVVTESVFSMDGDSPDILRLAQLCEKYEAFLVVDEAHATGVCGESGLGLMGSCKFNASRNVIIHTCSKALGAYGAFVTSSGLVRELLVNKARSFIYSTALPTYLLAHIRFSMEALCEVDALRKQLRQNLEYARVYFSQNGVHLHGSHVGYVLIQGNENVSFIAESLNANGFYVRAIRSPTVPIGQERLRITFKSFNTRGQIEALVKRLGEFSA